MCFHLKREFREVVMEGRGKWVRSGGRDRGGERKGFTTKCVPDRRLCCPRSLTPYTSDCFSQVTSVASRRVVPCCLFNFLALLPVSNTVFYMHQALDGLPLAADRPFIPTVQVSHQPHSSSKSPIILISEYLMNKMRPCLDWRRVLSGV